MIEADVYPPLSLQATFKPYEAAFVKGLTPYGHAELARERGEMLWNETANPALSSF